MEVEYVKVLLLEVLRKVQQEKHMLTRRPQCSLLSPLPCGCEISICRMLFRSPKHAIPFPD